MLSVALGQLAMRSEDFWNDTPQEFFLRLKGQRQQEEREYREHWEQSRMIAYYAVAAHVKKGKGMRQMIPLPWDSESSEGQKFDPEEVKRFMYRLNKTAPGWQDRLSEIS